LSLVISETLRGNKLNGILIALAPLITDLPIVIVSIFLLQSISNASILLGILSLSGGIFILYLSIANFRYKGKSASGSTDYSSSLKFGAITNFLSPHPYIFWITVGAPTFVRATKTNFTDGVVFILAFYLLLIGSKIVIAHVTEVFHGLLQGKTFILIMRIMGLALFAFACIMIYEGLLLLLTS
jgi:threonine/homoserine/homoserine lactone efflux protein